MRKSIDDIQLNERTGRIFRVLVELYIHYGQPVGSRLLARESGLDLSAATIRNVMADLEDSGLVESPHTSAGRAPTELGYRVFIDRFLTVRPPPERDLRRIRRALDPDQDTQELLSTTSSLLSGVTHMVGLVMLPRRQRLTLRQVAFLPLTEKRVLAVLVLNEREVQNRVVHTDRNYSQTELEQAAAYLNAEFAGQDVGAIREVLMQEVRQARQDMNSLVRTAADVGGQALVTEDSGNDYVVAGEQNLLGFDDFGNRERMRQLFEVFNRKRDLLLLLDRCLEADGLQVLIGGESGYDELEPCSLVTSPYIADDQTGVVAVIGPTRMAYEDVIPLVDTTARILEAALKRQ